MRTGVDMVDIARFQRVGDPEQDRLFARLFRPDETAFLLSPREMAQAFALKEAVSKALGTGIAFGVSWHDIQVIPVESGGHRVVLHGAALERAGGGLLHVSVDSTDMMAVAFALLEPSGDSKEGGV
jgi:holo-[acyl-carrier protein] synthase